MTVIRILWRRVLTGRVARHAGAALAVIATFAMVTATPPARAGGGYASIVMHARTGEVLHAHQADAPRDPAGLVKIMTVYLALHHVALGEIGLADRVRAAPSGTAATSPESAGHHARRLDALIADMLTDDDDDAAHAIATRLADDVGRFADRMHAQARRLNLSQTAFTDPAGDTRDHATARDLARLVRALVLDFSDHATTWSAAAFANAEGYPRGGLGVMRVGDGEGRGHAALAVRRDGDTLVVIILGAPSPAARDAHAAELLTRAFEVLAEHARSQDIQAGRAQRPLAMAALGPIGPRGGLRQTPVEPVAPTRAAFQPRDDAPPAGEDDAAHDEAEDEQERIRIILEGETDDPIAAAPTPSQPTAPPAPAAATRAPLEAVSYGVQVGAYADRARAEVRLSVVQDVWPELFATAVPRAIPAQVDDALVWRARFYDMTKSDANAACAALREKGQGCLLLTVSREDRAALGAPD